MSKALLLSFLLLGVMNYAFAQDESEQKWAISVLGGGIFPKEDDYGTTGFIGGRLTYDLTPNAAVGVESGWLNYKHEFNGTKYGDVRGIPLLADLILKMPIEAMDNKLVPYVLGGIGVLFWDYKEASIVSDAGIDVEGDTSFALKLGGGMDFFVSDQTALFVEGSYIFSNYDVETNVGGAGTADTDAGFVGGGLKVRF